MSVQTHAQSRGAARTVASSMRRTLLDAAMVLLATCAAQLVVVVQGGEPIAARWQLAFGLLAVLLLRISGELRVTTAAQEVYTVLAATALAGVVILSLRLHVAFEATASSEIVRMWAFVAVYVLAARVATVWRDSSGTSAGGVLEEGPAFELLAARELARARRQERPLAMLVLDPRPRSLADFDHRSSDLEELAGLLARELRLTDAFGVVDGRIVAILPDTRQSGVATLLDRLRTVLDPELTARVRLGHASFPDEEITLVGLQERALGRSTPLAAPLHVEEEAAA